jgi:hypothetical protein
VIRGTDAALIGYQSVPRDMLFNPPSTIPHGLSGMSEHFSFIKNRVILQFHLLAFRKGRVVDTVSPQNRIEDGVFHYGGDFDLYDETPDADITFPKPKVVGFTHDWKVWHRRDGEMVYKTTLHPDVRACMAEYKPEAVDWLWIMIEDNHADSIRFDLPFSD